MEMKRLSRGPNNLGRVLVLALVALASVAIAYEVTHNSQLAADPYTRFEEPLLADHILDRGRIDPVPFASKGVIQLANQVQLTPMASLYIAESSAILGIALDGVHPIPIFWTVLLVLVVALLLHYYPFHIAAPSAVLLLALQRPYLLLAHVESRVILSLLLLFAIILALSVVKRGASLIILLVMLMSVFALSYWTLAITSIPLIVGVALVSSPRKSSLAGVAAYSAFVFTYYAIASDFLSPSLRAIPLAFGLGEEGSRIIKSAVPVELRGAPMGPEISLAITAVNLVEMALFLATAVFAVVAVRKGRRLQRKEGILISFAAMIIVAELIGRFLGAVSGGIDGFFIVHLATPFAASYWMSTWPRQAAGRKAIAHVIPLIAGAALVIVGGGLTLAVAVADIPSYVTSSELAGADWLAIHSEGGALVSDLHFQSTYLNKAGDAATYAPGRSIFSLTLGDPFQEWRQGFYDPVSSDAVGNTEYYAVTEKMERSAIFTLQGLYLKPNPILGEQLGGIRPQVYDSNVLQIFGR